MLEVLSWEGALVVWQISGENIVFWGEKRGQIPSATSAGVHKVTVVQGLLAPHSLSVKPRAQKVPMEGANRDPSKTPASCRQGGSRDFSHVKSCGGLWQPPAGCQVLFLGRRVISWWGSDGW